MFTYVMPRSANQAAPPPEVKTGRRVIPSFEARDKTVCFMVSETEKSGVDRLAYCKNITRSGLLARIVTEFMAAVEDGKHAAPALSAFLGECQQAFKAKGAEYDNIHKHSKQ